MRIYNILSRLLDYPDEELKANLHLVREALAAEPKVSMPERHAIEDVVEWMEATDLLRLQEEYVDTFDHAPEHSLYLTHHSCGDSRDRGPALVELAEHYKGCGVEAREGELPDFLPLILEYVSLLDEMQIQVFLGEAADVLDILATNLEKAGSLYAPLIRMIESRGRLARSAA